MSETKLGKVAGALKQVANKRKMDELVRRLNRNTGVPSADQMRARGISDEEYARLKRGEEQYPLIAYHATPHSFDEFDRGDIGFHVGTAEQANGRINQRNDEGVRIMPLRVNVRSPLTVKNDVGSWWRPQSVAEELLMTPQLRRALSRDDMEYLERVTDGSARSIRDIDNPNPYLDQQMKNMRDILRGHGYDSIRYPNFVENFYREKSGDSPRLQNIYKRLDEKIDSAESDAEKARLSNRQFKVATRLAAKGAGKNDNYSWILLDPQQLRLQSAEFMNPTSRNLLAGTAATAFGLSSADAEEKADGGILRKVSKHV